MSPVGSIEMYLKLDLLGVWLGRTWMSQKEVLRSGVLSRVAAKEPTVRQAAELMEISYRQAKRSSSSCSVGSKRGANTM